MTLSLPQTSVVHLALASAGGEVSFGPSRTYVAGSARITGRLPRVASGTYRLVAVVSNGIDIVRTPARHIAVVGASPSPTPTQPPASPSARAAASPAVPGSATGWEAPLGAALLVLLVLAGLWVASRSSRRRRAARR